MSGFILLSLALLAQEAGVDKIVCPEGTFQHAVWSPDGKRIATIDSRSRLRLWDAQKGQLLETAQYSGFGFPVFSPAGKWLAVGCFLHDAQSGKLVRTVEIKDERAPSQLSADVPAAAFSPDGSKLALVKGPDLQLWEVGSGKLARSMKGHVGKITAVDYCRDGKTIVTGGSDLTVRVWNASTGKEVHVFSGHKDLGLGDRAAVWAVRIKADGKTVVSAGGPPTNEALGKYKLLVWKAAKDEEARSLSCSPGGTETLEFTSDEKLLLSHGLRDGVARLWNLETGQEVGAIQLPIFAPIVKLSPDGQRVMSGGRDPALRFWKVASFLLRYDGPPGSAAALAVREDGGLFATGGKDRRVRLWDPSRTQPVRELPAAEAEVVSLAFSADGARLWTGTKDGKVGVWNAATGEALAGPTRQQGPPWAIAPLGDGAQMAVADGKSVRILDSATGADLRRLEGHPLDVLAVTPVQGGKSLAVVSQGGSISLWTLAAGGGSDSREVLDKELEASLGEGFIRTFLRARCLAFAPDGNTLAFGSRGLGILNRTEQPKGRPWFTSSERDVEVTAALYSPDGRWLVTGQSDGELRLYSAETRTVVDRFAGHTSPILTLAFVGLGPRVLAGAEAGSVRDWAPILEPWVRFIGRRDTPLSSMAAGGRKLALADEGGIRVWDLAQPAPPRWLEESKGIVAVAVRAEGEELVGIPQYGNKVTIWNLTTEKVTRRFEAEGGLPLLSSNGKWLLNASAQDWTVWSVDDGKKSFEGRAPTPVQVLSISADGLRLLTSEDRRSRVVETKGGKEIRVLPQAFSEGPPAFSPDGSRVAVADLGCNATVYDASSGKLVKRLGVGDARGARMVFSADGKRLAVVSEWVLRVWEVDQARLLKVHVFRSPGTSLMSWARDGGKLYVVGGAGEGVSVEGIPIE